MTNYQIVTVNSDVAYNDEFLKLKRERKLSNVTNNLWKSHFNIKKSSVPQDEQEIDDELRDLAARKATLLEKKNQLEKVAKEEKDRYVVME